MSAQPTLTPPQSPAVAARPSAPPADYLGMMVAAGWIGIEDIDADYREYLHSKPADCDDLSYVGWQALRAHLAELTAEYDAEIEPWYQSRKDGEYMPSKLQERQRYLLGAMDWDETLLGY